MSLVRCHVQTEETVRVGDTFAAGAFEIGLDRYAPRRLDAATPNSRPGQRLSRFIDDGPPHAAAARLRVHSDQRHAKAALFGQNRLDGGSAVVNVRNDE
jgi:hypothetical protein